MQKSIVLKSGDRAGQFSVCPLHIQRFYSTSFRRMRRATSGNDVKQINRRNITDLCIAFELVGNRRRIKIHLDKVR